MNLHTELLTLSASLPRGHRDSYFPEISHFWDVRRRLGRASYAVDERNEVDGRYDVTDIVCADMLVIDFQSSCTLTLLGTQWTCSRWHLSCRERHECSVILNQPSRSNKWIDVSVVAGIISFRDQGKTVNQSAFGALFLIHSAPGTHDLGRRVQGAVGTAPSIV